MQQSLRIRDELEALLPHASFVKNRSIAVLLPCHNEEATIAGVIDSFRRVLPGVTGARILFSILMMYRALRPFQFYGAIFLALVVMALGLAVPVAVTYIEIGLVPRLPTAILAASLMQLAFMSLTCGIIIDAVSASRREFKRMRYLDISAPGVEHR